MTQFPIMKIAFANARFRTSANEGADAHVRQVAANSVALGHELWMWPPHIHPDAKPLPTGRLERRTDRTVTTREALGAELARVRGLRYATTIGDGVASTFTITHNLALANKDDYVIRVAEIATGASYLVEDASIGINSLSVTFGFVPAANTFRVAVLPVR